MSCYLRHLHKPIAGAGITLEKGNRKEVDRLVREWARQEGVQCNVAWKVIKNKLEAEGEASLESFLKGN